MSKKISLTIVMFLTVLLFISVLAACNNAPGKPIGAVERSPIRTVPTATRHPPIPTKSTADDLPMSKGDEWVYRVTLYSHAITTTLIVTDTVVETKKLSLYTVAKVHREETIQRIEGMSVESPSKSASHKYTPEYYWWVVAGNKVYRQERRFDLQKLGEAIIELDFPLRVGKKWYLTDERAAFRPSSSDQWLLRKVAKRGAVSVPAGRFEQCFLMQDTWGDASFRTWFCPGIGIVKKTVQSRGPSEGNRLELLKYCLSNNH